MLTRQLKARKNESVNEWNHGSSFKGSALKAPYSVLGDVNSSAWTWRDPPTQYNKLNYLIQWGPSQLKSLL